MRAVQAGMPVPRDRLALAIGLNLVYLVAAWSSRDGRAGSSDVALAPF